MQQKSIIGTLSALAVVLPSMAAAAADNDWQQTVG